MLTNEQVCAAQKEVRKALLQRVVAHAQKQRAGAAAKREQDGPLQLYSFFKANA